eukprot:8181918-Lingulodinium_polyedra.AAC.1
MALKKDPKEHKLKECKEEFEAASDPAKATVLMWQRQADSFRKHAECLQGSAAKLREPEDRKHKLQLMKAR